MGHCPRRQGQPVDVGYRQCRLRSGFREDRLPSQEDPLNRALLDWLISAIGQ